VNNNLLYNSMLIKHVDLRHSSSNILLFRSFWRKADISGPVQIFQTNTHDYIFLLKTTFFISPTAQIPLLLMTICLVVTLHVCLSNTGFPKFLLADIFWLLKIITNFHIHREYPEEIHTNLKIYISELILSSICTIAWN
jgi:hypothetical protein